jgi:hypothetical protein
MSNDSVTASFAAQSCHGSELVRWCEKVAIEETLSTQ